MPLKPRKSEVLPASRPTDAVPAVIGPLRRFWALLSMWRARVLRRRALATLNYGLLRDAGLTREGAARESRKPFWRA